MDVQPGGARLTGPGNEKNGYGLPSRTFYERKHPAQTAPGVDKTG